MIRMASKVFPVKMQRTEESAVIPRQFNLNPKFVT